MMFLLNSISINKIKKHWHINGRAIVGLGLIVIFAGCSGGMQSGGPGGKDGNNPGGGWMGKGPDRAKFQIPVTCERIERRPMEAYLQTVGSVVPYREVELKSEYTGRIYYTKRWKDGDMVTKGELIANIDDRALNLDIAESESQLQVAKEGVQPASASLSQAIKDEKYNKLMLERGAISRQQYEQTVLQRINAEENYKRALANVETRKSALDKLRQDLEKVAIRAPFDGMLLPLQETQQQTGGQSSNLTLNEGLIVGTNQSICRLADIQQVVVELAVPGKDIDQVKIGQKVELDFYSKAGRKYYGQIYDISSTMDATTRTFTVKVLVDNPDKELRPGMFSKARIITETHLDSIVVNRDHVMLRDNRHVVYVVVEVPDIASATEVTQVQDAVKEMDRDAIEAETQQRESHNPQAQEVKDPTNEAAQPTAAVETITQATDYEFQDEAEASPLPMKYVAQERIVTIGIENRDEYEIVGGLQEGDLMVVIGYETLTDNVDVVPTTKGETPKPEEETQPPAEEKKSDTKTSNEDKIARNPQSIDNT